MTNRWHVNSSIVIRSHTMHCNAQAQYYCIRAASFVPIQSYFMYILIYLEYLHSRWKFSYPHQRIHVQLCTVCSENEKAQFAHILMDNILRTFIRNCNTNKIYFGMFFLNSMLVWHATNNWWRKHCVRYVYNVLFFYCHGFHSEQAQSNMCSGVQYCTLHRHAKQRIPWKPARKQLQINIIAIRNTNDTHTQKNTSNITLCLRNWANRSGQELCATCYLRIYYM